ncbi:MAG: hypothetical protein ABSG93_09105 [Solirubrobacteraceae bacterium]
MAVAVLAVLSAGLLGVGGGNDAGVAVRLVGGVPVGVQDTPAGALAAADNYVALASQSLEQDPTAFAELVAQAYAPQARAGTVAEAQRIRAGDSQNMSNYREGGRGIAVIAARRLDRYTPHAATVTSWLGGFVWGPRLAPRQTWNLIDTSLRWQAGRWLVVSSSTDTTPAPVPSIVYVDAGNDRSAAFARLAGMSAPFYGTGG